MKTLPLIACLLMGSVAVFLYLGREDEPSTPPSSPSKIRNRAPRATSVRELLESTRKLRPVDCKNWVRSLSDAELERVTRAMIDDYLATFSPPVLRTHADFIQQQLGQVSPQQELRKSLIPLLTLLAMESGRRDIDGFLAQLVELGAIDHSNPFVNLNPLTNLRCAAAVGLAEDDPPGAWDALSRGGGILKVTSINTPAATEAIIREWAKNDPVAAWEGISSSQVPFLAPGIRGLLAEITDASMRATILEWVLEKSRATNPPAGQGTAMGDSPRKDGIGPGPTAPVKPTLNNPNRIDPDQLRISAALGLAEQDPRVALEWINVQSQTNSDERFLTQWAQRQPEQSADFWEQHPDEFDTSQREALSRGLQLGKPVVALEVFPLREPFSVVARQLASSQDEARRANLEASLNNALVGNFTDWVSDLAAPVQNPGWPLLPNIPEPSSPAHALTTISQNIDRLNLEPELEARALQAVDGALEQVQGETK